MLARRGLLRNADPHLRCGNVSRSRGGRARPPGWAMRETRTRGPMTVNLTRIYTKLGDGGETHLGRHEPGVQAAPARGGLRHRRRAELATIGVALLQPGLPEASQAWLRARAERPARRRRRPVGAGSRAIRAERERLRVGPAYTEWLEQALRRGQRQARAAALVRDPRRHPSRRAPARRAAPSAAAPSAARSPWATDVNPEVVRYLNRLSDLLFILGRAANAQDRRGREPESLWDPGAHGAELACRRSS